jgi:hypothetical protein
VRLSRQATGGALISFPDPARPSQRHERPLDALIDVTSPNGHECQDHPPGRELQFTARVDFACLLRQEIKSLPAQAFSTIVAICTNSTIGRTP